MGAGGGVTTGLIAKGDEVHFGDDEDVLEQAMAAQL